MNYSVIVPIRNAVKYIPRLLSSLLKQKGCDEIIIIDSESNDGSREMLMQYDSVKYVSILENEFNHGGTRNMAMQISKNDIVVFVTQDVYFDIDTSCETLVATFDNPDIGIAYGRQVPYQWTSHLGVFARIFNYPEESRITSYEDKKKLGIKTVFNSNSFAAYRRTFFDLVGGFPTKIILGEDTYIAAKMLKSGYRVAYNADAVVCHSHDFTIAQEFSRNFDIGVFHASEDWLKKEFGNAEGEGVKFVMAEIKYLLQRAPYLIPYAIFRDFIKYIGYRVGAAHRLIPVGLKKKLTMHELYWSESSQNKSLNSEVS